MALEELRESNTLSLTKLGGTAHREFKCGWDEALSVVPLPGLQHPDHPLLRVTEVKFDNLGPVAGLNENGVATHQMRKILVDYAFSYTDVPLGEAPKITVAGSTKVIKTMHGRTITRNGNVEIIDTEDYQDSQVLRFDTINLDTALASDPLFTVMPLKGTINASDWTPLAGWITFGAGTVEFSDYNIQYQFDYNTWQWYFRTTYQFEYFNPVAGVQHTWNEAYFGPKYDRVTSGPKEGEIQYWQDKHSNKPAYTTDAGKVGKPVYVTGYTSGGWYVPDPPLRGESDFDTIPLM